MTAAAACWSLAVGEDAYPTGLEALEPPARPRLWGCGERAAVTGLDPRATVTVVGSRNASGYGLRAAERLGHDLAAAGLTVVSGMARGIDAAAQRGALAAGGTTIAVLAGGPDVVYPPANLHLYAAIVAAGAAISEHPPGTGVRRHQFPARNRLMAALGGVVVIVEAALPSGSMITADLAAGFGRTVGALPGQTGVRVAEGTNTLIREGAHLIRDASDVLDLCFGVGVTERPTDRSEAGERPAAAPPDPGRRPGPPLDSALEAVLELVGAGAATVDRLAAEAGIAAREAAVALARLERLGYVAAGASGRFERSALTVPPPAD